MEAPNRKGITNETPAQNPFCQLATNKGFALETVSYLTTLGQVARNLSIFASPTLGRVIEIGKICNLFNLKWNENDIASDFYAGISGIEQGEYSTAALSLARVVKRVNLNLLNTVYAISGIEDLVMHKDFNFPCIYRTLVFNKLTTSFYQVSAWHQASQLLSEWDRIQDPTELAEWFQEKLSISPEELAIPDLDKDELLAVKEKALEIATCRQAVPLIKEAIALIETDNQVSVELGKRKLEEAKRLTQEEMFTNKIELGTNLNFFAKMGLLAVAPQATYLASAMTLVGASVGLWKAAYDVGVFSEKKEENHFEAHNYSHAITFMSGTAQIARDERSYFEALERPLLMQVNSCLEPAEVLALARYYVSNEGLNYELRDDGAIVETNSQTQVGTVEIGVKREADVTHLLFKVRPFMDEVTIDMA